MPRATLILRDGTTTVVDGTSEEVAAVMNLYQEKMGITDSSLRSGGTAQAVSDKTVSPIPFQVVVLLIYSVISLLILVATGYGVMKSMNDARAELFSGNLMPIVQLWEIKTALIKMRGDFDRFILVQESRDDSARAISEGIAEINERMDKYRKISGQVIERKTLTEFHNAWTEYQHIISGTVDRKKTDLKRTAWRSIVRAGMHAEVVLETMISMHEVHARWINQEGDYRFASGVRMMLAVVVVEIMLGCGLVIWISRRRKKSD